MTKEEIETKAFNESGSMGIDAIQECWPLIRQYAKQCFEAARAGTFSVGMYSYQFKTFEDYEKFIQSKETKNE